MLLRAQSISRKVNKRADHRSGLEMHLKSQRPATFVVRERASKNSGTGYHGITVLPLHNR